MGLLRSSNVHQVCTLLHRCVIQQEQNVNKKCPESHKVSEKWRNQKVTITTLAKLVREFVRFVRSVYEITTDKGKRPNVRRVNRS